MFLAGLFGAAGVAAAAAASHGAAGPNLGVAAQFLMIHAGIIAAIGLSNLAPRRAYLIAGSGLALGVALFSGDLTLRATLGHALFAMAAPLGGTLLIVGWLALCASGLFTFVKPHFNSAP